MTVNISLMIARLELVPVSLVHASKIEQHVGAINNMKKQDVSLSPGTKQHSRNPGKKELALQLCERHAGSDDRAC